MCIHFYTGFWVDRNALYEAASHGHVLELKQLIENGACVNVVTADSITPLHGASLKGQTECVKLLLAAGAQVSICICVCPVLLLFVLG